MCISLFRLPAQIQGPVSSHMLSISKVPSVKYTRRAMKLSILLFSYANTAFIGVLVTGIDTKHLCDVVG